MTDIRVWVCCPVWWEARKGCKAWPDYTEIVGPVHGCGKEPGHEGGHTCPCGSRKPAEYQSPDESQEKE